MEQIGDQGTGGRKDQPEIEKRFADFELLLNDKASKQSVAQALHRKINKEVFDEALTQKSDLVDINRICQLLEQKVDHGNFEKVLQAMENKAERFELQSLTRGSEEDLH